MSPTIHSRSRTGGPRTGEAVRHATSGEGVAWETDAEPKAQDGVPGYPAPTEETAGSAELGPYCRIPAPCRAACRIPCKTAASIRVFPLQVHVALDGFIEIDVQFGVL